MKNLIRIHFLLLLSLTLLFGSCQKEEDEFIDETNEETITANSTVTQLLIRSSENAGDFDDIIDGNSCASVVLPVTVFANGQEVVITDEDDYDIVEAIFNQFPNDEDTLEIQFPITIILEDFTQVVVNSQTELDAIIAACDGDIDDSIGCVDFVYPITFFIYDSNQQQIGTTTVNSDIELYQFLSNLNSDEYISIDFPISVIVNGEVLPVVNNQELIDIISNADCDDSSNDDPIDNTQFVSDLTSGVWYITYYFDDYDETSDFNGYEFNFSTDNTATATNGNNTVNGTWNLTSGSTPDLELFFGTNDPLDELDDDWDIIEATSEIIRLKDVSGGDGSTDYLTFERTPNDGGSNSDVNELITQLTTGNWYVNLYDDDGDNETCDYVDYTFTFNTNGTATATSSSATKNGFWSVESSSNSTLDLILNFEYDNEDDPFEDLNDDWDVLGFDATFINLQDISGGNGGTDLLNFGRTPYDNCNGGGGNAQTLRDIMTDGQWYVQSYIDDGDNETGDYNGYTLTFNTNGTVMAQNSSNTFNGTWAITQDSSGLDFVLDFGTQVPFDEFNDDWDVLNFISTRVELEDVSGGNGGTDTLVFEKI
ncbi:hypothetical protein [Altibacter lentus]|uniref:hypothetical protein n=1 Tax=Altibacter lentus TaxID=1223410 RepID=UPI0005553961|nr:hypothetical protein [Altibacter lentus]